MPTKIIEHAIDKITTEYGYNDNPWTEADEELTQALVKMYDHELAMDKKAKAMMTGYFAAQSITEAQREELGTLQRFWPAFVRKPIASANISGLPCRNLLLTLHVKYRKPAKLSGSSMRLSVSIANAWICCAMCERLYP